MSVHQLACTQCQQVIPVSTTQAGQNVTCSACQAQQTAPTMGKMRQLPLAVNTSTTRSGRQSSWTALQGRLFAVGFVLLMIGLIGGGFCYYRFYQINEITNLWDAKAAEAVDGTDFEQVAEANKNLNEAELWEQWRLGLKMNLDRWQPNVRLVLETGKDGYFTWVVGYVVSASLGLLSMLASFFVRGRA